ncbi:MAG: SAM-dependent methyltransferase [Arachnia sp.]
MGGLAWTRCPHCALPLTRAGAALRCATGHSHDVARQGYVNLLGHAAPANADTPAMLDARARFLAAGHYAPLADALARRAAGARRVVEVGAGTGYYLARVLDAVPDAEGLATDVSVAAAKRAARAHPRAASVVADTWAGLPIVDAVADVLLCVFAPRNPAEFARILAPGGRIVLAVPGPDHLAELRADYGLLGVGDDKTSRIRAAFPGWAVEEEAVRASIDLTADEVADVIAMGPNAFHGLPEVHAGTSATVDIAVLTLHPPSSTRGPDVV